jgi:pantetheine-phosphate adenylyltransferase
MSKIIYPGTFDPITLGHIDLIKKATKIFDQVIVATTDNINKKLFFSLEERVEMIKKSLFKDSNLSKNKIKIVSFDTLTIDLCKKYKANVIMRGLRATSDFEYEFQLAGMNKKLNNQIETIFLMSDVEHQIISSNFVREIAVLKGNLNKFLSKSVIKLVKEKFE